VTTARVAATSGTATSPTATSVTATSVTAGPVTAASGDRGAFGRRVLGHGGRRAGRSVPRASDLTFRAVDAPVRFAGLSAV
jgi:hypothetical protein